MNQILNTKIVSKKAKLKNLQIQFFISFFALFFFLSTYFFYKVQLIKEEELSKSFSDSYEIYKLYSEKEITKNYIDSDILGSISIPKLNIKYPFFYGYNNDLLKIAPCRFYGEMPNANSNLCITGHNYDDDRFFGRIKELITGDQLIIEDNLKNRFIYNVFDKYEVDSNDLSPVENFDKNSCTLTLITCNNLNKKRIIIKAKLKA